MNFEQLNKLSADELFNLSDSCTDDFRYNRSDVYMMALKKYEADGNEVDKNNMRKEMLAFDLVPRIDHKDRFIGPAGVITDDDIEFSYPDLNADFPDESMGYYQSRIVNTNNPILKARYADLIWVIKQDYEYALTAIDSYLDCADIYYQQQWDIQLVDAVNRTIEIALSVNNDDLTNKAVLKSIDVMNKMLETGQIWCVRELVQFMVDNIQKLQGKMDLNVLINTIERAILSLPKEPGNYTVQRAFWEMLIKAYKYKNDDGNVLRCQALMGESFITEAEWRKVNYPNGNMAAASIYQDALIHFINIGKFPAKVDEIKLKIVDAHSKAKEQSEAIPIVVKLVSH